LGFINYKKYVCVLKVKSRSYSHKNIREKEYKHLLDWYKVYDSSATNDSGWSKINKTGREKKTSSLEKLG